MGTQDQTDVSGSGRINCYACPVNVRPEDLLQVMDRDVRFAWSEPDGLTTMGYGSCVTLREDQHSLASVQDRAADVFNRIELETEQGANVPETASPRFFGGVSCLSQETSELWRPYGQIQFVLPELQFVMTPASAWLTVTRLEDSSTSTCREAAEQVRRRVETFDRTEEGVEPNHQLSYVERASTDRGEWESMVKEVLSAIERGDVQKVVLSQRRELEFNRPFSMHRLQKWLFEAPDSSYRFLFHPRSETAFAGRSPECIIQKAGAEVRSESVGGTIETGQNKIEQEQLAEQLVENRKDQHEHSLVVKSIRDALSPYVDQVTEGDQTVRVLSNVQHLCTPIQATLTKTNHVLDLLDELHPTSAIGGYPRHEAIELIRQLESFHRGWYGGPVGWFDREGDGCFAVGIRSGLMNGRNMYLYAGAGLVEGSEPEREWEEVQWKFESMTSLLTDRFSPARSS